MKLCLVMGMGVTGKSVCNFLIANNYLPVFYDDKFSRLEDYKKVIKKFKLVVTSPTIKESHELVVIARAYKIKVLNEIDLAYLNINSKTNIIGVTGTNGKTTVVSMLEHLLEDECKACGNIGVPFIDCIKENKKNLIVELSSFQLNNIKYFKPNIACILNLKPDHIDFHKSEKDYFNAKLNIVKNLTKNDFVVLNVDDKNLSKLNPETQATKFYFGMNNKYCGCYFKNGGIYYRDISGNSELLLDKLNKRNALMHNVSNIMAVCTILKILNYNFKKINKKLNEYNYQPFRLEFVQEYNGIEIYNDSKATNVASVQSALDCFKEKNVCLILGGVDKNESFCELLKNKNINMLFVFGSSAGKIINDATSVGFKNYTECKGLEEIVEKIKVIKNMDIVLFSPGCSSKDMFLNYEERGAHFNKLIGQILH